MTNVSRTTLLRLIDRTEHGALLPSETRQLRQGFNQLNAARREASKLHDVVAELERDLADARLAASEREGNEQRPSTQVSQRAADCDSALLAEHRDRVADAILHALRTRTTPDTELWPGGPKQPGFTLSCHEIADVALGELRSELAELQALRVGLVHLEQMEQSRASQGVDEPGRPDGCGPDCADTHMYDGYCTEDPHLEGITSPGPKTPNRASAAWRCAEDDGCGHLSLGHYSEAEARRSYDRHRAGECPRVDPFDTPLTPTDGTERTRYATIHLSVDSDPRAETRAALDMLGIDDGDSTAPASGGAVTLGPHIVGESRAIHDPGTPPGTQTVSVKIDGAALADAMRKIVQPRPTDGGEQQ